MYAKLAEAQMDIANGDEGVDALDFVKDIRKQSSIDIDTAFTELMGKEWAKKHIK